MPDEFHRIRRLPPYVFAEVNTAKARARAAGEDIIDLGMGNPDSPTPPHIVAKLVEAVQDPRTHRYSVSKGIPGLRRALAGYYQRRFDVALDPETEVIATLGSKEGLANLAAAITSPGDTILVPNPSYPIHQFGFIIAGAAVRSASRPTPDEEMLRALDRAVRHSVPKPTALIVNFPSNPTAYLADLDFYREIVAFARRHEIWIMSDLAYAEIYFGDKRAAVAAAGAGGEGHRGRVHLAVEDLFHAGLAHGLRRRQPAADHRADADEVLSRLRRLHADPGRRDRGAERAAGLRGRDARAVPRAPRRADPRPGRRRLGRADARTARCSPGRRSRRASPHLGSVEFTKLLLARAKVAVAPGIGFGEHGDGHVRIALVENTHRLRQAVRNIRAFLQAGQRRAGRAAARSRSRRDDAPALRSRSPASAPSAAAC